jgi:Xaa-Pro aminopeptidase
MDVLIYGDAESSPALRHEVPVGIGDPFLYLEHDGRRVVVTNTLEEARIAREAPDLERLLVDALGRDDLIAAGHTQLQIEQELCRRAAAAFAISAAVVPTDFPLAIADALRASGITLTPDESLFRERRRHKTQLELDGIGRAAGAAVESMREAARMLREAEIRGEDLRLDGEVLTSDAVRGRIREVCSRMGAPAPSDIMVKTMGPDPSIGHDPGSGPLRAHQPILIDLWPRDEQSACCADMTRTFVRGEITDQIGKLHQLVIEAHRRSSAAVAPGVTGGELYDIACEVFEAAGHSTRRTSPPGQPLRDGFYHALGHGIGLALHEAPMLGRTGSEQLIEGEVIAIEPGVVDRAVGAVRVEDLLLVTERGSEQLTGSVPYELAP